MTAEREALVARIADTIYAHTDQTCLDPTCGDGFGYHDLDSREERRRGCEHVAEQIADLLDPVIEHAVEVTWVDPAKAGAKGKTSQYDPFTDPEHLRRFHRDMRSDIAVASTRVLTRVAAYTDWIGGDPVPIEPGERDRLLQQRYDEVMADRQRQMEARA